jgi:large repetitive protein
MIPAVKSLVSRTALALLVGQLACLASAQASAPPSVDQVRSSLGKSTLPWVPNAGQWDAKAAFRAQSFAGSVWMTHDGKLVHQFNGPKVAANDDSTARHGQSRRQADEFKPGWVLTERFVGGVVKQIEGIEPNAAKASYFLAGKPASADLQSYGELALGEVYPGVTVALKATQANVEKLYTVAPRRDPAVIRMQIDGANALSITADGSLQAATDNGPVAFTPPVAFQYDNAGNKIDVKVAYALDAETRQYGFTVGDYDRSRPLTIDPLLGSTYLGVSNTEGANAIAVHPSSGVVYVAGKIFFFDLPGASGGAQPTNNGGQDAFIARYNAGLTALLGSTHFGGAGYEVANGIAINPNTGNVYITGETRSSSLPGTAGSPQPSAAVGSGADAFVAVFNGSLDTLIRASFHGAAGDDQAFAIAYHPATAEIYIGGFTTGVNLLPGRIGGAQPTSGAGRPDCFVTRFSADLTQRLQSTYISGSSGTLCELKALAVHPVSGDMYAVGITNHPSLTGAAAGVQSSFASNRSAFVTRLNKELTIISASSYNDNSSQFSGGEAVAIHSTTGDIYVGGSGNVANTASGAMPGGNGFISRFNAVLSVRHTATYVALQGATVTSLVFNAVNGNLYAAGTIQPGTWTPAAQGVQPLHAGGPGLDDGFVARLNAGLTSILGATFYGSSATDEIRGIAYNPLTGNIYVAGETYGANLPGTSLGVQPASGGERDAFVTAFTPDLGSAGVTPNPFTLSPRLNVVVNSTQIEGPIQITELTAFANVSIVGALGSVCISTTSGCSCNASGNVYVTGGMIANNQYLCVKNVAAPSASTLSDSTITVGGYTTKFMNYTGQLFACTMDIDGDGVYRATTDGAMLTRALLGLTGTAVTNGLVGHNPPRNTWALIRQHLNSSCGMNLAQ